MFELLELFALGLGRPGDLLVATAGENSRSLHKFPGKEWQTTGAGCTQLIVRLQAFAGANRGECSTVGKKRGSVKAKRATPQRPAVAPTRGSELHQGSPFFLALTAVGIVFGDIGTSPLYTLAVTFAATGRAAPTAADVLGIISLILWALLAMVSVKYVVLVLRADNEGEGGILALLSLVDGERIANGPRIPVFVLLGIVGAALLYGDGVITPAISVLSAIEGLKLVAPAFDDFILPLTLAILIGLFMVQRRGTAPSAVCSVRSWSCGFSSSGCSAP
jgi:hypothetical protein